MKLELFTDLIDALGKVVASALKAIANLAKAERETTRRTLDETYRPIDTTLDVGVIRMCDNPHAADAAFVRQAGTGWTIKGGESYRVKQLTDAHYLVSVCKRSDC